jgi:hypothetical protein
MPNKTTTAKTGAKGATVMMRHPMARRAGVKTAKVGWFVGKKVAKRKAKKHARRFGDIGRTAGEVGRTAGTAVLIYGPMAAEVFGRVERPKPRQPLRAFAVGIAVGVGVMALVGRNRGA